MIESLKLYRNVSFFFGEKKCFYIYEWSTVPIGAGLISKGNYTDDNGVRHNPAHISLYIGDGEIIEAGGSTVKRLEASETCGKNNLFGWIAPTKLYEEAQKK